LFGVCSSAALKWPLQSEGYLYLSLTSPKFTSSSPMVAQIQNRPKLSLFLHWHTLSSQATPLISPSILEREGAKTWLERRSTDSPSQKSIWFVF
jgi:hypothetical protein